MSGILSASHSGFFYSSSNTSAVQGKATAGQTTALSRSGTALLTDDAYMPGTEGQMLNTYTRYHLSSGGRMDYRTGTIQQGYIALTLTADGTGAPSQGLVTEAEIDKTQPGAVFANGQWTKVADYFADRSRIVAEQSKQTDTEAADNTSNESMTWNLSREESASIFGANDRIYISELVSDDPASNPFTDCRRVDPSELGSSRPTPLQMKQMQSNPGMIWSFGLENKAFEGHDILNAVFDKTFSGLETRERIVDEYGYGYSVPGSYDYTHDGNTVRMSPTRNENGEVQTRIESEDLNSSLKGLTLDERDTFWSEMQKIFDRNGLNLDARQEDYGFMPSGIDGCGNEPAPGGWSWSNTNLDAQTVQSIRKEIAQNGTLNSLFEKADKLLKGEILDDTLAQQYSIRVTDDNGNRLANDRIIVEAKNGNQVEMTVDEFKQMDRKAITLLLQ